MPKLDLDEAAYNGRNEFDILAGVTEMFQGNAVGEEAASGDARPLVAGDAFLGFVEAYRNTAEGDTRVRVKDRGVFLLNIPGVAKTDRGATVHATDEVSFALAGTSPIGTVHRFDRADWAWVKIDV